MALSLKNKNEKNPKRLTYAWDFLVQINVNQRQKLFWTKFLKLIIIILRDGLTILFGKLLVFLCVFLLKDKRNLSKK